MEIRVFHKYIVYQNHLKCMSLFIVFNFYKYLVYKYCGLKILFSDSFDLQGQP